MSAAATTTADAPAPKGKKKLLVIIVAAVVVLAIGGVGALLLLKKGHAAADDEEADADHARPVAAQVKDPKHPPVFAPLEPFTVNLADREAERYAQVGITLELDGSATSDALKVFMPAVRNNILMLLAHKTSAELMERDGKDRLAKEVAREAARGLGVEVEDTADEDEDEDHRAASKKKRKRRAQPELPVVAVYFSTFIIQ
jgi:flagellar FliL protein